MTQSNVTKFSQFFHSLTQQKAVNKNPTTTQMLRYIALFKILLSAF